ncbi:MAG: tRNA pseudouridine(55) synthase TruB [Acidimicrobiales bacterium]
MIDGLVVVDKAAGWTSHDAVARCRKVFGQRRVGHAGTLDPDATGVLLVGLGRVTRLLRFLTALPKSYTAEVVLGVATTTLDAAGEVTGTWDMAAVDLAAARAAASGFVGEIEQIPPMVSALKVGGRRLHELARAGVEVERAPRRVVVSRFSVEAAEEPGVLAIEVGCSSGTYVRSLAADLGAALGGGAHLRNLRRTAIGSFTAGHQLDALSPELVLTPAEALRDYPRLVVDEAGAAEVGFGRSLPLPAGPLAAGPHAVVDTSGTLIAVYTAGRPDVVLPPP